MQRMFNKLLQNRQLFSSRRIEPPKRFDEKYSKARVMMRLYDLTPLVQSDIFVAPNATIVGQVFLGKDIIVGHNTVIRGDINMVQIYDNISIGNNCVLHTAASVPSGLISALVLRGDTVIENNCTLYSCDLHKKVFIGHNSVIMQGAILQEGAIIAPNSVVPPGRIVKALQVWGGNPIKFIRKAKESDRWIIKDLATTRNIDYEQYTEAFLPYPNAYLYKPSSEVTVKTCNYVPAQFIQNQINAYNPNLSTIN